MKFRLEKRLGWIAIPNIALILVTLQAFGFLFVSLDPIWFNRLALFPDLVFAGEYWRVITFLALPFSMSPIVILLKLWFLYYAVNIIETEWGAFKTTSYVLFSILLMISFSLICNYPILEATRFESTLFLAAASLVPNMEVLLFFLIPVKLKWLAWLAFGWIILDLINGHWLDRIYILITYLNYLAFFGPAVWGRVKQMYRRWEFRSKL